MTSIESDQNSITPKGTRFAKERLAELIEAISDIQKNNQPSETSLKTAEKLGINNRLSESSP